MNSMQSTLPKDSVLLPLLGDGGALLLSRNHAVFCRIPRESVADVARVIRKQSDIDALGATLRSDLEQHGFFDAPMNHESVSPAIRLQITNDCNLSCAYCCTDSGKPRPTELGEAEWLKLVDQASDAGPEMIRFDILGGEPLLAPFVFRLADHIQDKGHPLALFTNGTELARPRVASEVARLVKKGMAVRVSLAGPTAATCDGLSEGARYRAALDGIDQLHCFGAGVHVTLMLFPETVDDTATHLADLRKRLPKGTTMTFGIPYLGGREEGAHMFESRTVLEEALDRIALEAAERVPFTPPSPTSHRREACHCAFGNDLHIRSDGVVFGCFKMEEPLGSFADQSLAQIWRAAKAGCRFAKDLATCADCCLNTLCGGGCRSENALYTGDPNQPLCGPWRVQILAEMLAEDRVSALTWSTLYLINEARARGLDVPFHPLPKWPSLARTQDKGESCPNPSHCA